MDNQTPDKEDLLRKIDAWLALAPKQVKPTDALPNLLTRAEWQQIKDLLSATLPHNLIYKLHGWTGQLAEQPPSRIAPGIAQAAKRLHDELQLYVGVSSEKDKP